MHEPLFGQKAQHLLDIVTAERLRSRERQLERRALDVIDEDVEVVRIDERALRRRIEEVTRISDDELIERRAARHHDRRRSTGAPAGSAGSLPCCRDRAWIAGHDRHVERADVDAKLERVRRHDRTDRALAQSLLDLTPPHRQIAAAIAANSLGRARHVLEVVLQVRRQDLRREAALGEHDQLEVPFQELGRDPARFAEIRAADAELMVDDRRVHEDEELLAARRAGLLHELERLLGQPLGELARIGDRRRRADESLAMDP